MYIKVLNTEETTLGLKIKAQVQRRLMEFVITDKGLFDQCFTLEGETKTPTQFELVADLAQMWMWQYKTTDIVELQVALTK